MPGGDETGWGLDDETSWDLGQDFAQDSGQGGGPMTHDDFAPQESSEASQAPGEVRDGAAGVNATPDLTVGYAESYVDSSADVMEVAGELRAGDEAPLTRPMAAVGIAPDSVAAAGERANEGSADEDLIEDGSPAPVASGAAADGSPRGESGFGGSAGGALVEAGLPVVESALTLDVALHRIADAGPGTADVLEELVRDAGLLMDAPTRIASVVDEQLVWTASYGDGQVELGAPVLLENTACGAAWGTALIQHVASPDLEVDNEGIPLAGSSAELTTECCGGAAAVLAVPLLRAAPAMSGRHASVTREVLAVLAFTAQRPGWFTDSDIEATADLAEVAGERIATLEEGDDESVSRMRGRALSEEWGVPGLSAGNAQNETGLGETVQSEAGQGEVARAGSGYGEPGIDGNAHGDTAYREVVHGEGERDEATLGRFRSAAAARGLGEVKTPGQDESLRNSLVSGESALDESVWGGTVRGGSARGRAGRGESVLGESGQTESVPGEMAQGGSVPGASAQGELARGDLAQGDGIQDELVQSVLAADDDRARVITVSGSIPAVGVAEGGRSRPWASTPETVGRPLPKTRTPQRTQPSSFADWFTPHTPAEPIEMVEGPAASLDETDVETLYEAEAAYVADATYEGAGRSTDEVAGQSTDQAARRGADVIAGEAAGGIAGEVAGGVTGEQDSEFADGGIGEISGGTAGEVAGGIAGATGRSLGSITGEIDGGAGRETRLESDNPAASAVFGALAAAAPMIPAGPSLPLYRDQAVNPSHSDPFGLFTSPREQRAAPRQTAQSPAERAFDWAAEESLDEALSPGELSLPANGPENTAVPRGERRARRERDRAARLAETEEREAEESGVEGAGVEGVDESEVEEQAVITLDVAEAESAGAELVSSESISAESMSPQPAGAEQTGEIWVREKILDLDMADAQVFNELNDSAPAVFTSAPTTMHARLAEMRETPRALSRSQQPPADAGIGLLASPGSGFPANPTGGRGGPAPRTRRERPQSGSALPSAMPSADSMGLWQWDAATNAVTWSSPVARLLGLPADTQLDLSTVREVLAGADRGRFDVAVQAVRSGRGVAGALRLRTRDGQAKHAYAWSEVRRDESNNLTGAWGGVVDITAFERDADALRSGLAGLRAAQELAGLATWEWRPQTQELIWSDEMYRLVGVSGETFAPDLARWHAFVHPDDLARARQVDVDLDPGPGDEGFVETFRLIGTGGEIRHVQSWATPGRAPDGSITAVYGATIDVTRQVRDRMELERIAATDPVTGLGNRSAYERRVQAVLRATGPTPGTEENALSVLLLDLDRFKVVNDGLGHETGDRLLIEVARRLVTVVPDGALIARMSGDEFTVLTPAGLAQEAVLNLAQSMLEALRSPYVLPESGEVLICPGSVGIASNRNRPGSSGADLLREADVALHQAKASGRDAYVLFDEQLREATRERRRAEQRLRIALADDGLSLEYQPIVDLASNRIVGAEALVRLQDPEGGEHLLAPGRFLDVAEKTGLIVDVDTWVINSVIGQLRDWSAKAERLQAADARAGDPSGRGQVQPPWLSINLSARSTEHPGLAFHLIDAVRRGDFGPEKLKVELAEQTFADVDPAVENALRQLISAGIGVGIDDYGSGSSALSTLQSYSFDFMKIDRSFVAPVGEDSRADAVVTAIVDLAHAHGMRVVAEGVESGRQARRLREIGCDYAQGFHFGRPGAAAAIIRG
ncbi:putative bifunctional diguanylate cyclase/phosphodiesterase [Kineosporia babensis]|uniref:EAL domain-containing protein n=1 Tax=Kineosporia babensis TaxID=499548 RepID=A0A9X1N949_9ACTN|nr:GGDEF domain-containing phosphodiesterase [Kineosporia babensis]MCD5309496.1 EAL domain-containing protein [Kineosporia babensis]